MLQDKFISKTSREAGGYASPPGAVLISCGPPRIHKALVRMCPYRFCHSVNNFSLVPLKKPLGLLKGGRRQQARSSDSLQLIY